MAAIEGTTSSAMDSVTKFIVGSDQIAESIITELLRTGKMVWALVDSKVPKIAVHSYSILFTEMQQKHLDSRLVTEITEENLSACKELAKHANLRHLGGAKGNFVVTDFSYICSATFGNFDDPNPMMIYSNVTQIIDQNRYVFENLWNLSVPAAERIREIEEGIEPSRIEVIKDSVEVFSKLLELIGGATKEIQIVLPTANAFHRQEKIGVVDALEKAAKRGAKVRILSPFDHKISKSIAEKENWQVSPYETSEERKQIPIDLVGSPILFREIDIAKTSTRVSIFAFDDSKSFVIEQKDDSKGDFSEAIGLATYSNSTSTVASYIAIFEKLWRESELRESEARARKELAASLIREERAAREAKLLQDILAHDMRNYNQVIQLATELLWEHNSESRNDSQTSVMLESLKSAVEGSTTLLERAKKLGKILSDADVKLFPVNIFKSIEDSMALIRACNPRTKIIDERVISPSISNPNLIYVYADELLDDVFQNVYTNAVKYTESDEIFVQTRIDEDLNKHRLIVSISDRGKGIPDDRKYKIFSRYLESAKGSGLGMSIVHALVVDRYKGEVKVKDRVPGDYSKGTTVEIVLRKA